MAHTIWSNILQQEIEVESYRNADEPICVIRWCMEDLWCKMAEKGIPITDENIDRIMNNRFEKTLQDRSTEEGWEIIDTLIDMSF